MDIMKLFTRKIETALYDKACWNYEDVLATLKARDKTIVDVREQLEQCYAIDRDEAVKKLAKDIGAEFAEKGMAESKKPIEYYTPTMLDYTHQKFVNESVGPLSKSFLTLLCSETITTLAILKTRDPKHPNASVLARLDALPEQRGGVVATVAHIASAIFDNALGTSFHWLHTYQVMCEIRSKVRSKQTLQLLCNVLIGGPGSTQTLTKCDLRILEEEKLKNIRDGGTAARRLCQRKLDVILGDDNASPDYNPRTSRHGKQKRTVVTMRHVLACENPHNKRLVQQDVSNGPLGWPDSSGCAPSIFDLTESQKNAIHEALVCSASTFFLQMHYAHSHVHT
jgi:hypothetical protein